MSDAKIKSIRTLLVQVDKIDLSVELGHDPQPLSLREAKWKK
jgi:hypothetical protein